MTARLPRGAVRSFALGSGQMMCSRHAGGAGLDPPRLTSYLPSAFEIEATTSVYSGLLRMSDLLALQPNIDIRLYLVAPDERREKVGQEILRPTFTLREKPLREICGFLSFSKLVDTAEGIRKLGI